MEIFDTDVFADILLDVVLNSVSEKTVFAAKSLRNPHLTSFDFILSLAGASEGVDYHSLREVACEGLIYDIKGGDNGILNSETKNSPK